MKKILESKQNESVGDILRSWRQLKRISQMDLALDVGISSRHLSFVETGKSQPSRDLILRIAQTLKLPLRHRNAFLNAAGYAAEYSEESFNGQKMEMVRQALQRMIEAHEPYPAFVVNAGYNILMTNSGFDLMMNFFFGGDSVNGENNVYRIIFAENGLRQYIQNWEVVEHFMLTRLWDEVISTQNSELIALYNDISKLRSGKQPLEIQHDNNLPILSLSLEKDSATVSFFTTITTLGTPLDLTTQELRIEALFPADEETKQLFHS